jgi:hypothetical protein
MPLHPPIDFRIESPMVQIPLVISRWRILMMSFFVVWNVIAFDFGTASIAAPLLSSVEFAADPNVLGSDKLGQVGTKSLYYLNDQYQNPEARSVQLFEGRITREADESEFSLGIDLEGQFSVNNQRFNSFTANEFYFRMDPLWTGTTLYLGRKRSRWSALDDRWKLGVWQPLYKVDSINPHSQGLTGLFVVVKQDDFTLEFFGTPFFLPDHGPVMETRNGSFVTGHPWVQYPPSEVILKGQPTPAFYQIDKPSIPDVIVNTGYGMNLQWGDSETEGWLFRGAWAYKPMNQLQLGFDGNLSLANEERLEIDIHPEVGFHKVGSLDGSYRSENWGVYAGLIVDQPEPTHFDNRWTYQEFSAAHLGGIGTEYLWGSTRFGLGYLRRDGGDSQMAGPRAGAAARVLPERFQFDELLKMEVTYRGDLDSQWSYELMGEWRQELKEQSEIVSGQGTLLMGPFWRAYMGMDLLRTNNLVTSKADFAESYQSNDRVYGGIQYVF